MTPWTATHQAPLSTEFSRQEYWSGLPFPSPGDLPNPGIEPESPTLQADSLPPEPQGKLSVVINNFHFMATWCEELTHLRRPWCWERLRAGGEGDNRGWDGWMVSPTQWTWVWINSGSWWWTGRPGVLQSIGLQRVGHNWAIELTDWWPRTGEWCGHTENTSSLESHPSTDSCVLPSGLF